MKPIRASDIGSYLYCRRAWWYRFNGYESANQAELSAGTEFHRKHGRTVLRARMIALLGWVVLMIALVVGVGLLTWYGLGGF